MVSVPVIGAFAASGSAQLSTGAVHAAGAGAVSVVAVLPVPGVLVSAVGVVPGVDASVVVLLLLHAPSNIAVAAARAAS
jgi:hypothetical protein